LIFFGFALAEVERLSFAGSRVLDRRSDRFQSRSRESERQRINGEGYNSVLFDDK
jgi:hypothetical protein